MKIQLTRVQKRKYLLKLLERYPSIQFDEIDRKIMESHIWSVSHKGNLPRLQTRLDNTTKQCTRLIMAAVLGRALREDEMVKSINHIPLDLRRENLTLTSSKELVANARLCASVHSAKAKNETIPAKTVAHEQTIQVDKYKFKFTILVECEEA